uniref:Proprotein convertase subtilisin/kexin type 5a n=1 Tax=Gasterosteus aculeatus aculeatus TaxID=481459 RepID=A0AAQ4S0S7_GASAC|nr:proprotein convertase subtilisin/kexin type 5 isoform X2 [Gasterosteus aculeatus aculeatus]
MVRLLVLGMGILLQFCRAAIYTNDWAMRITGGRDSVHGIAEKYGFTNMGQIGDLKGYYSLRHRGTAKRSTVSNKEVVFSIAKETKVEWFQQQVVQRRVRRSHIYSEDETRRRPAARPHTPPYNYSIWDSLWYNHCGHEPKGSKSCMNIAGAWRRGYTGKGVVVSVLDDGIQGEHPDLKPNYDARASYDVNRRDEDPSPNNSNNASNYHGTQCAGAVAAAANNSRCTVGVAFHARIGGIRMLDGDVTDIVEAQSLSFRPQHIDIYLASWGPEDDGATLEGPGPLARLALRNGIKTGRHGRGSVYVWASGSGGQRGDHCSCDGYGSSIYTISISSSRPGGNRPDYLERCSSTLATAYAGGETEEMVALGPRQSCSRAEPETSLSSSVAAGIIALTLEANPLLTWRDVQHIIVRTSISHHLPAPDWSFNGAGYEVSHLYGFGLLDAENMVKEAERWKRVPTQHECVEEASIQLSRPLDDSAEGFQNWEFMTTHSWGEQAPGEWTLKIQEASSPNRGSTELGTLKAWSLRFYGTAEWPYPGNHRRPARSAEMPTDGNPAAEYGGPCDPECGDDGCEGPSPQHCVTCLHFFLKFKNSTRMCVSECPRGFWGDRRRCKRCFSSCGSCVGSRSDQCTSCQPGHHLTEGTNSCTAACGDNFYLDHDANMCRRCNESCLRCTSSSICTQCKPGTSLQGNRCQRSCTPGFYHDEQDGTCQPCHKACASCAGAGVAACDGCAGGFLMEEWKCLSSCSAGFYAEEPNPEIADGQRTCRRCDASCLTCVGPSRGNCSSCSSGHGLQEGACVVNTVCKDGEYQDADRKCRACDATCLKCTGPRREDCISCAPSRALDVGLCVAECAKGKYQSGGQCHLCDHTCATCVDARPANCTSCDTDKFGVRRYLYEGLCVDACPEAFYHAEGRSCESCSPRCRLCTGAARCLRCDASSYLSDGVCAELQCGEGEVEDPDYDECMACEEGCRKCVLYNPKHCLSCIEGFYNFQDGCYRNCPAKTYSVDEDMTCVPCDGNCVSCDEHECYWCETDLFLSEGRCVSSCPGGFYGDEDTNDCEECHSDCVTCGGPERDDCLSCEDGKKLENGECVSDHEVCPIKTFRGDDGECENCHPSCESCSGEEKNQCIKCAKGLFLTAQQTCVLKCPGGFFAGRLSGVCEACPPGCLQCADVQHCIRCQSTRKSPLFLQAGHCVQRCVRGYPAGPVCRSCAPGCASCGKNATHCLSCEEPLLLHEHRCAEECPPAHTLLDGECQRCPRACQECGPLGHCTGCEEYHFLHEGLCVPDCPERFFEDKERRECLRCHPDCALCDGPKANDCDACVDPEAALHNGACLAACPSHAYRDAITGECKDCAASCLTCSHAGSCTGCREGQRLEGRGHCVPLPDSCSPEQYADQRGECHRCHKYCHRCSGPGKTHCLSCNQRHLLLNGTCVDGCPEGFYEESGQTCEPCHASCRSCVGKHGHECLACKIHLFREAKECVETCQHSHYGNTGSGLCERCDPSCSECAGGEEDACLSCAPGLVYLRREGRCLPSCPRGYYHDAAHRACGACHASCRACSGSDSRSCDSCFPGYRLAGGLCESLCDMGLYPVTKDSHHACEDCDGSCVECRGPGPANCTACSARAILEAGGRCLLCCRHEEEEEEEGGDEEEATTEQQDCCNCTETRGVCVLSTNLAFRNEEEEAAARDNPAVFIVASVLLVLGLVAVVFIVRHSRSKRAPPDIPPRGYEKLGSGGGGGGRHGGFGSASSGSYGGRGGSAGGRLKEAQLVDVAERRSGSKGHEEEDDEDEDEDIVYMGQDGTVYRKFRYLGDEDELEYDDESYTFR